ncbi:MAG TPA: chromosome segregation protein SMC [Ignavibacteria bacterium]
MYLSKLEIFGFKSFADKTTIDFGSGVSAIVGPNGSGKSNIVDAIRWVLGEQGDKALRSEKREDVVFSGTKNRKPLSVAEVSLTIQNNLNKLPTEYSEVQIARRFFRSGETEYYLNGTKVRLKEIRHLFVDTGIGPDAYSVIELKMIETILSAVKNERRKLFEEAAGIVSYKQNRDLTYKRLESVHETLLRVNDIIREKQRNVNALERQVKKNEEAKTVYDELKILEIKVSKIDYDYLQDEIKYIKDTESEKNSLKETLFTEINESDQKLDILRSEILQFENIIEDLNLEIDDKKDGINTLERDNLVIEQRILNKDGDIKRLSKENDNFRINIEKNTSKIEEIQNKIQVLNDTLNIAEHSLEGKKKEKDDTLKLMSEKKSEMKELDIKLKDINKSLNINKTEYQANKINFENNLSNLERISNENRSNLLTINDLEKEKEEIERTLNQTNQNLKYSLKELTQKKVFKQSISDRISDLEKKINIKNLDYQKLLSKVSYLTNLLETFEDYAEGVQHLLKSKNDDIYSIIDSISVEEKFKIAIETALGEISNYLIVNDSTTLNKLVNSLVTGNKGKVTFILNDKFIKNISSFSFIEYYEPEFIGKPGIYGFANTLVKCDNPELEILFNYLLDEYVIVEDISTAYKLAKDNYYKFITLEGDIVTDNVIRTGGKLKEENIRIGREKQIEKLKGESGIFKNEIDSLTKENENLKTEFESLDLVPFQIQYDELFSILNEKKNELSKIEFKISEINKSLGNNDLQYTKINNENKKLNDLINDLIIKVNENESEHSNFNKELAFLIEEFSEIEQNYNENNNDYNSFSLEVIKLKNELKNEEQSLNRINNTTEFQSKQILKNKDEIVEDDKKLEVLRHNIKKNNEKLEELKKNLKVVNNKYDEKYIIFDKMRKEQADIDIAQRTRRKKYDDVSQKLINSQIKIRENDIKSNNILEYILHKYELDIALDDSFKIIQKDDEDTEFDLVSEKKRVEELSERLKKLGGGYQQVIWEDFQVEKEELQKMIDQRTDLYESEKDIKKTIERINQEAREKFLKTFEEIRQNFIKIFKELFQEGDESNLRLVYEEDEEGNLNEDPLEAKIEITAKPRGKRPTSIELLSGGEKTLTAIALLFAIYLVKPSPFCILDEVDAPLDVANLSRFNKMIRKFSENTQFILITHNERTMEKVDKLYGVTMQEAGVTTIVETKFKN